MKWTVLALMIGMTGASDFSAAQTAKTPMAAGDGWPCDSQPKAALVLSDFWPDAVAATTTGWRNDPGIAALVNAAASRSLPADVAAAQVRAFAKAASPASKVVLATALTEAVNTERHEIMVGIGRFNARQHELAHLIDQSYVDLSKPEPMGADPASAEARRQAEEQAHWNTLIFDDRQRMLPLICRQPAALEARLALLIAAVRQSPAN